MQGCSVPSDPVESEGGSRGLRGRNAELADSFQSAEFSFLAEEYGVQVWASDLLWSERLGKPSDEADMLTLDRGQTLGFTRMAARRNQRPTAGLDTL